MPLTDRFAQREATTSETLPRTRWSWYCATTPIWPMKGKVHEVTL
jgi:hypothetical protein